MSDPQIGNVVTTPLSSPWYTHGWVQGAAIFMLALIGMLYYQFVPGFDDNGSLRRTNIGLPDVDSYYHTKMAWLYRTGEAGKAGENFHWTRESTWSDTYSDKDYLFHLYLIPFSVGMDDAGDVEGLVLCGKYGVSVLGALLTLTLFVVMRRFGVKHAWAWVLVSMAVGGTYWIFRLNMCRSYLISITLALAGWYLIARGRRLALFLVATVFTLAYTASHLLFAMLLVRAVMELLIGARPGSTRKADLKSNAILGGCIAGGIALGCVLHPHSLELVELWWVQNVVVLALSHQDTVAPVIDNITALFGHKTDYTNSVELQLGRELGPTDGRSAVLGTPLIFFTPMLLPLMAAIFGHKPSREAILTATIAVVWLVGYMLNGRFIEYATPFMTLAAGVWGTELMTSQAFKGWQGRWPVMGKALPISALVVAVIAGLSMWVGAARSYRALDCGDIEMAGRFLHQHEPAHGKVVWHDRWDDFPQLIFFASECDYLIGLDPTFFLVHDEEKYELWTDIRRGKKREFVDTIKTEFGADYILAHRSSSEFFYNRLNEEARAGRLKLLIRDNTDRWALYEIVPKS